MLSRFKFYLHCFYTRHLGDLLCISVFSPMANPYVPPTEDRCPNQALNHDLLVYREMSHQRGYFYIFCLRFTMIFLNIISLYSYKLSFILLVLVEIQLSLLCSSSKMKDVKTELPGDSSESTLTTLFLPLGKSWNSTFCSVYNF